jgi:3-oxoadipate enol-lactonase
MAPRLSVSVKDVLRRKVVPAAPVPPTWLPLGRVVPVSGHGEMFVRTHRPSGAPDGSPTLLLLHGWTASADLQWSTVYREIGERHAFVAVDHRGHGRGIRSEERFTLEAAADDAAALVRHLGVGPVVAVGYSMGGPIALHLALRHPDLVAGLVLEATAMEWRATRRERWTWQFLRAARPVLRPPRQRRLTRQWMEAMTEPESPELLGLLPWLAAEMRRTDTDDVIDAGWALSRYDVRSRVPSLRHLPSRVVVTTGDGLVAPAKQRALAAALDADVVELAGDHLVFWQQARAFATVTVAAVDAVVGELTRSARDADRDADLDITSRSA